jgi:hypothetical protein
MRMTSQVKTNPDGDGLPEPGERGGGDCPQKNCCVMDRIARTDIQSKNMESK